MDRENIGGNMSGQQSNYVSRGGNPTNNKWSIDGVDMTDLAATGSSSVYYDFDAFQEMTKSLRQGLVGGVKPLPITIPESGKLLLLAGVLPPERIGVELEVKKK